MSASAFSYLIFVLDGRAKSILLTLRHCHLTYAYNNMNSTLELIDKRTCSVLVLSFVGKTMKREGREMYKEYDGIYVSPYSS
jgi:hypothetical protein